MRASLRMLAFPGISRTYIIVNIIGAISSALNFFLLFFSCFFLHNLTPFEGRFVSKLPPACPSCSPVSKILGPQTLFGFSKSTILSGLVFDE